MLLTWSSLSPLTISSIFASLLRLGPGEADGVF